MALLEITVEQILSLIQQLPLESKQIIYRTLNQDLDHNSATELDEDARLWLEADLTDEPAHEYDWGEQGIPGGQTVQYVPGRGLIIQGLED